MTMLMTNLLSDDPMRYIHLKVYLFHTAAAAAAAARDLNVIK